MVKNGMDDSYLILFGIGLGIISFLLWMLFPIGDRAGLNEKKEKPRGFCPICGQGLQKGEKIRSSIMELGDVEVQTTIKGCPYCLEGNRSRQCPVCKKKLKKDESILAFSDPQNNKNRLAIRGCKKCYPQGFS